MKTILKPIFEWLVDQLMLFENPIHNWILAVVIGIIAFVVAWNFVGRRYRDGSIRGRTPGSILHWTIRILVVIVLYFFVAAAIWLIKFVLSIPWWGWLIVLGVLLGIAIAAIILHRRTIHVEANSEKGGK